MQTNQQTTGVVQQKPNVVTNFESIMRESFIDRQLTSALAENKGAFVSSLVELYTGDKSLQSCNPKLVALEAVKAASLNLPINKALGFAYIVVYNINVRTASGWQKVPTPTFVLGYKGYIQLASRTGQYRTINATPVYEGEFKSRNRLTGAIDISGTQTSDKVVGYAAYIEYKNGFNKCEYMTVEEMAKHAIRFSPSIPKNMKVEDLVALASKEPESKKVGWLGNFNDMATKTVIRRLISKYGFMSVQMQTALANDISEVEQTDSREVIIASQANKDTIDLSEDEVVMVDESTGEVIEPAAQNAAAPVESAAETTNEELPY